MYQNEVDAKKLILKPQSSTSEDQAVVGQTNKVVINVVKDVERFTERRKYATNQQFEYPRNGKEPGIIVIFNNETFSNDKDKRRGSRRDLNELILCLQRQGYNIYEEFVGFDCSKQEILDKLDAVANDDELLSDSNCLMVFFMSHGGTMENVCTSDGETLGTKDIMKKFARCKPLDNKPKMFVFQACKGKYFSSIRGESTPAFDNEPSDIANIDTFSAQVHPDMLVVYSTLEGNVSFRNPFSGSWFIQELCKNISSYGRRDDVVSIIIRTTKCVSGNYYHYNYKGIQKQMPLFVSTLKRKFYLNRNKDRAMVLQMLKNLESATKDLRDIKKKIDYLYSKERGKNSDDQRK